MKNSIGRSAALFLALWALGPSPSLAQELTDRCREKMPPGGAVECKPSTPTPWLWYQYASHNGNVGGTDLVDASNPAGASEARAWDLYTQDLGRKYTLCQGPTVTFSNDWHTVYPTKPDTNLLRDFTVSYGTPGYNPQGQLFCMPQSSTGRLQRGRQLRCSGPGVWSGPYGSSDNVMRCVCNDISCQPLVDQSCAAGNPILPGSGVKVAREDDYLGAGTHPLSARRLYRSRMTAATSAGWMSEWARRLDLGRAGDPQAGVTAVREDGRIETYALSAGIWAPYSGAQGSLETVRDASGAITAWQLVRKDDDSVETFDTAGRLLAVQARNGWTTTLSYSTSVTPPAVAPSIGLLIGVKNHFGRELRFTYDSQGRMRELLPPGAISGSAAGSAQSPIVYRYEELASLGSQTPVAGQLTSVTWQDGHVKRYHYEDARFPNNLTGITDELGVRIGTYAYNAANQAISTQGANGADRLEFQYSGSSNTLVTDYGGGSAVQRGYGFTVSNGVIRPSYVTSPCPLCGSTQKSTVYDAAGNTTKTVAHDGRVSFYAYDAQGRETERATFPSSYQSATTRPPLSAATSVTSTQWHATWKLPIQVAEPGKLSSYSYDAKGNLTGQSWTATTDATGAQGFGAAASGSTYATGWAYDGSSLPVSVVERVDGAIVSQATIAYDSAGNATGFTNSLTGEIATGVYDAHGRLVSETDPYGITTTRFTPRGFALEQSNESVVTAVTHNAIGLVTSVRSTPGIAIEWRYTAAHKVQEVTIDGVALVGALGRPKWKPGFDFISTAYAQAGTGTAPGSAGGGIGRPGKGPWWLGILQIGYRVWQSNQADTTDVAGEKKKECDPCDQSAENLGWSPHNRWHTPPPRTPWATIVSSTAGRGKAKYHPTVVPNIVAQQGFEQAAWNRGTTSRLNKRYKYMKFGSVIGASEGAETVYVRIECTDPGVIHGHPVSPSEYQRHIGTL